MTVDDRKIISRGVSGAGRGALAIGGVVGLLHLHYAVAASWMGTSEHWGPALLVGSIDGLVALAIWLWRASPCPRLGGWMLTFLMIPLAFLTVLLVRDATRTYNYIV